MFYPVDKTLPKGFFKACVVPRPIAWISSISASGHDNLAPFSFFNIVCEEPPMVMFSTTQSHHEGGEKDTLKNVEETGEFIVHLTTDALKDSMNLSSMALPRHVSEFDMAGLAYQPAARVKPKRLVDCPISMECQYYSSIQLPSSDAEKNINRMVIGTVLGIHVCASVIDEQGAIDITRVKPLARLGYQQYLRVTETFDMPRPVGEPTPIA